MKPARKHLLAIPAALLFVYVMTMPVLMGGFGYGSRPAARTGWQASLHYNHGGLTTALGGGLGWMGSDALLAGVLQVGLLVAIVLGSVWLLVGAVARQSQKPN